MDQFLTKTYYNNTVGEWAIALGIVLGTVIVGKVLYWIFKTVVAKATSKSETKIDDLIIDMIDEPIVVGFTAAGVWFGLKTLTLTDKAMGFIDNSIKFLIVLAVTWMIARLVKAIFTHYLVPLAEASENELDDQILPVLSKGANLVIWVLGLVVALDNAGYDIKAVLAGLGIGGLALAMAAKDTVSNFFGGVTIFVDRPFKLNDRVKISGFDGTIEEIGIRSTRLRTLAGTLVTIPNATFASSSVENISEEPSRKVVLNLGLTYDTTPEGMDKGIEILKEIAAANENLEEKVLLSFNAFGDFAMNILFIYYIKKGADILEAQTEVNRAVLGRFNEAGLEFAFPTQTLYTIDQPASS